MRGMHCALARRNEAQAVVDRIGEITCVSQAITACTRGASWRRWGGFSETGIAGATKSGNTSTIAPCALSDGM